MIILILKNLWKPSTYQHTQVGYSQSLRVSFVTRSSFINHRSLFITYNMYQKNYLLEPVIPFDGELLNRYERRGLQINGEWAVDIHNFLTYFGYEGSPVQLLGGCMRYDINVVDASNPFSTGHIYFQPDRGMFHIYEIPASPYSPCKHGVLLESASSEPSRMEMRDFYALLLLNSIANLPNLSSGIGISTEHSAVATRVATLFERELLLSTTSKSGWNHTGMLTFIDKATFWTRRYLPIQMALPAFPCKTTNRDKAAASVPDGGEFEALVNLSIFCQKVEEIYEPGCFLSIVSDGHVFSDCIGADDSTVTAYSRRLKDMLKEVHRHHPVKQGGIEFLDLEALLALDTDKRKAALG